MIVPSEIDYDVFVLTPRGGCTWPATLKSAKTGLKTRIQAWAPRLAVWSSLCSSFVMETQRWLRVVTALLLLVILPAGHAQAQDSRLQRVRTDSRYLRLVLASGIERSPTFRRIVDLLEHSDLIVEVQCGHFVGSQRAGRTVLLSAQPGIRYVLVEIACWAASGPSLHMLGHELRHALEIADEPWVVDSASLSDLYRTIGYPTLNAAAVELFGAFETEDAINAGERIHHELHHPEEPARIARNATK